MTLPLWVTLAILGTTYAVVLRRSGSGEGGRLSFGVTVCLGALVVVCLFWQTERLASLGGEALAQDIKDNLDDRLARVEVFSAKDLQIDGPGVTATRSAATTRRTASSTPGCTCCSAPATSTSC